MTTLSYWAIDAYPFCPYTFQSLFDLLLPLSTFACQASSLSRSLNTNVFFPSTIAWAVARITRWRFSGPTVFLCAQNTKCSVV